MSEAEAAAGFHGGSRNETQYCVVCHTDQRRYGQKEATFTSNGAIRTFTSETRLVDGRDGRQPAELHPQDPHGAASWSTRTTTTPACCRHNDHVSAGHPQLHLVPRRLEHGLAHDQDQGRRQLEDEAEPPSPAAPATTASTSRPATGLTLKDKAAGLTQSNINGTGLAHPAGPLPDDSQCALCHKSNGTFPAADIDLAHFPVTPPNPDNALAVAGGNANTNSAWIASGGSVGRLPPGAITPTYEVQSVSRNASKQPVMVFRWLQNGTAVPINDFATAAVNPATGQKEMWDNFMGSPSAYFVFAVPQDGIAAPADFNATVSGYLRKIWDGTRDRLRRGHPHRSRRQRLLHRDAHRRHDSRQRRDADRRDGLLVQRHEHAAADPDQPARLPGDATRWRGRPTRRAA